MKKRIFGMLLVAALLLSGCQAHSEGIRVEELAVINNLESESIWEERAYLDEFNMPTDDYYISNSSAIIGTFSNSATTDSLLEVYLFIIEGDFVVIRLIEYGSSVVKNSYSSDKTYSVVMMDTYGERYSLIGTLSSGADVLSFDTEDSSTIIQALRGEGTVRFAITEDERSTTKYIFSIEDTYGLEIDAPISEVSYLGEGVLRIKRGDRYGLMDTEGNIVARCVYYFMTGDGESGLIRVATGRNVNFGFINRSGEVIIPCEYDYAWFFNEGLACVVKDGKCGFIDATGSLVIPCEYDYACFFSEGLACVKKDDKYGYIDTTGSLVIPCEYDNTWSFNEGLAYVEKNGKCGYIDTTGSLVVPCEYDFAWSFSEGLACVKKDDKYGYIDATGSLVVPCEYDDVGSFSEGLARVKKDDKWGYIDTTGTLVVPCEYDDAWSFSEGLAKVEKDGKYGYIDTAGSLVFPCEYKSVSCGEDVIITLDDEKITVYSIVEN